MSDNNNAKLIDDLLKQVEMLSDPAKGVKEKESPEKTEAGTTMEESSDTSEEGFNPLTEEAYKWMTESSIPGAFPPILYCGQRATGCIRISLLLQLSSR